MSFQDLVPLSNICQSSVALIGFLAYLPQWLTLYRTKSSKNISLYSWILWSLSAIFALFYAVVQLMVYQTGTALVFTSSASVLFIVITLAMVFRYRTRGQQSEDQQKLISLDKLGDQVVQSVSSATHSVEKISEPLQDITPHFTRDASELSLVD